MKNLVVINETHVLMEEQISLLNDRFGKGNWERLELPAGGLKLDEIKSLVYGLPDNCEIVIASPVPAMLLVLSQVKAKWSVFHNDNRDKIEIPDGRSIMTVSKTGWVIF